jgi:tRNA A58 N-methylase Trm61
MGRVSIAHDVFNEAHIRAIQAEFKGAKIIEPTNREVKAVTEGVSVAPVRRIIGGPPGSTVRSSRGQEYYVDKNGSLRRVAIIGAGKKGRRRK